MANRYARTAGGNWTDNATWSTTSGGAADTVAPTASDDVFLDANSGQVTISAASVGKSLTCTGYTNTLTHNAFALVISGSVTLVSGMTYTPTVSSSTILSFGASGTLTTGGKLMPNVSASSGVTLTLGDNLSFYAAKTSVFTMNATAAINMNSKNISGNSSINRVLINVGTLGTSRTISNLGTFANADFRDITFSSATDLDLSSITGGSGDCGGNTITGGGTVLTFTTAATQTATGNSANWSAATWSGRVPLPQDDVVLSLTAGQTLTNDMPRMGKSISVTTAMNLSTNTIAQTLYGSLDLTNVGTFTSGTTGTWTFEGRGNFNLTSSGKSFVCSMNFNMVGGQITLLDAFSESGGTVTLNNGTFNANNFSVLNNVFASSVTTTRALIMGSGTWTMSRSSTGNAWDTATTTALTFSAGTSTILISDTGANAKTFAGGGLTYNNLSISGGGTGAVIITGANTFNRISVTGGTKSITLPGSTTTTIISNNGLGNGTNLITFTASAGSATISCSTGTVSWDYVSLTNIPSTGGATFYAGPTTHSTDGGGNTGWIFTAPVVASTLGTLYDYKNNWLALRGYTTGNMKQRMRSYLKAKIGQDNNRDIKQLIRMRCNQLGFTGVYSESYRKFLINKTGVNTSSLHDLEYTFYTNPSYSFD